MPTSKTPTPQPEANMKRAQFFMPQSMIDALERVSQNRGGSQAMHVRKAVDAYLNRLKVPHQ